jgi:Ca2+-binding EF-hand superfamily protein
MMKSAVLLCVLGLVCVSGERAGDDMEELGFEQEHRKLSHEATIKLLNEHFQTIDANNDGKINYEELEKRFRANMDAKFQAGTKKIAADEKAKFDEADTNHDGSLSESEHTSAHGSAHETAEMFKLFDVNGNDKLDFNE